MKTARKEWAGDEPVIVITEYGRETVQPMGDWTEALDLERGYLCWENIRTGEILPNG